MHGRLLASALALGLLAACDSSTAPPPTTAPRRIVTVGATTRIDLDGAGPTTEPADAELEVYRRSGAPWFASVFTIDIRPRRTPPMPGDCAAVADWTFFEQPISALPTESYYCVRTTEGRIARVTARRAQAGVSRDSLQLEWNFDEER